MLKGRFMKYLLFFLLPLFLSAESSFITPMEYATSLYKNPRGIGCQKCHGESGEGKLVAKYIHKKEEKVFGGAKINEMDFTDFYRALNKRIDGMPRYFLTDKEIQSLYFYLQEKKKEENK
ncbi:MAG: hypothetical protein QG559_1263 [Campylobacterota bacterium]|nr:hypothetical protein [Campylobacterota bacterium]